MLSRRGWLNDVFPNGRVVGMVQIATRDQHRAEQELATHVRKAVNSQETAPKQKHVRSCIVFAWDHQTCSPFWQALKMQPVLSDPVSCFKALVTIHKVLVNGPPVVLSESVRETGFLEQCARIHGGMIGAGSGGYGYGPLISSYVSFLLTKIEFHRAHPEFTGNFDYEEYLSVKGVQNLDEGYKTVDEMMELQERLDLFQRSVFENFGGSGSASLECRVSAFVPLIDESYGMWKFVTSMLSAMHLAVESPDPLILLVERYNKIFWALRSFYGECSKIRYLTSLVAIPQLPDRPPQFSEEALRRNYTGPQAFHKAVPTLSRASPRPEAKPGSDSKHHTTVVVQVQPSQSQQPQMAMAMPMPTALVQSGPDFMMLARVNAELTELQEALQEATEQHETDQGLIGGLRNELQDSETKLRELSARYNELVSRANAQGDDLRGEIGQWRGKYETCARLYTELRSKYLQLTTKLSESARSAQVSSELQIRLHELEAMRLLSQQQLEEKTSQVEALMERIARLEGELEELRAEEVAIGGDLGDALMDEMARAAEEIARAMAKLAELKETLPEVHVALVEAVERLAVALAELVAASRALQTQIVSGGDLSETSSLGELETERAAASFYKKNSVWTAGLISAAQAVASATTHLVGVADSLLRSGSGNGDLAAAAMTPEHMIVASSGVTASTAQLVAAARVKANPGWSSSGRLEKAARAVSEANKALVQLVATRSLEFCRSGREEEGAAASPQSAAEFRIAEMDQQVEILTLERKLQGARMRLSRLRQSQYQEPGETAVAVLEKTLSGDGMGEASESESSGESSWVAASSSGLNDSATAYVPPSLEDLRL